MRKEWGAETVKRNELNEPTPIAQRVAQFPLGGEV
jgi:hypothetical protein